MNRMKSFFTYAVLLVGFYLLSNLLIYFLINGTYKEIKGQTTEGIEVVHAKATYVNGYIDGRIINSAQEKIINKYVKIDIYSERNVCLGTKYIEIAELDVGEKQDFHIGYKFTDSNRYEISIVDNVQQATDEQFLSDEIAWYAIGVLLVVAIFI